MTKSRFGFAFLFAAAAALAQRPSNPALLVPQDAPVLDLKAANSTDFLTIPAEFKLGPPASTAFDAKGHLYLLNRGPQPIMEFDADGKFIREFGDGLFNRSHGLYIDKEGNIWATDVFAHTVMKFGVDGQLLLTLGTKGQSGDWQEGKLTEPNDLVVGRNGDIFVVQGHTPGKGDPRVIKFDKTGKLIKSWGGPGTEPGKFVVAHGISIDAKGQLWVSDRENQRIQIFDQDGKYIKELKFAGLPCGVSIGDKYIYMVNGFAGQLLKLDLDGKVLSATGKPGKGVGEFGEAHYVSVSPKGDVYVSDTVNSTLQRFK